MLRKTEKAAAVGKRSWDHLWVSSFYPVPWGHKMAAVNRECRVLFGLPAGASSIRGFCFVGERV